MSKVLKALSLTAKYSSLQDEWIDNYFEIKKLKKRQREIDLERLKLSKKINTVFD